MDLGTKLHVMGASSQVLRDTEKRIKSAFFAGKRIMGRKQEGVRLG